MRENPGGGYELGAGSALPPMLLDDEAAVAVAVGLRVAASGPSVALAQRDPPPVWLQALRRQARSSILGHHG